MQDGEHQAPLADRAAYLQQLVAQRFGANTQRGTNPASQQQPAVQAPASAGIPGLPAIMGAQGSTGGINIRPPAVGHVLQTPSAAEQVARQLAAARQQAQLATAGPSASQRPPQAQLVPRLQLAPVPGAAGLNVVGPRPVTVSTRPAGQQLTVAQAANGRPAGASTSSPASMIVVHRGVPCAIPTQLVAQIKNLPRAQQQEILVQHLTRVQQQQQTQRRQQEQQRQVLLARQQEIAVRNSELLKQQRLQQQQHQQALQEQQEEEQQQQQEEAEDDDAEDDLDIYSEYK